ncbi:MAG: hypothetical protein MJK10_03985 [Pseudomonadales bacterium]|nr:hypothetical protein [Pseudomonadales bacterium]NRA15233.1 hypothetical protein [Oceanospirillaceae bacterium]
MSNTAKPQFSATPECPYFVYGDSGEGFVYFNNEAERDAYAKVLVDGYYADGWDENVEDVVAGKLTHTTQAINRVERPGNIDEEGYDEQGTHWEPHWSYMCSYELLSLSNKEAANDSGNL